MNEYHKFISSYYEKVLNNYKEKNKNLSIEEPNFFIGKTPKILIITPYNDKEIDDIILNGKKLKKIKSESGHLKFLDTYENIYYSRLDDNRLLTKINNKKIILENDGVNTIELKYKSKLLKFINEILNKPLNKKISIDDFAIFSYFPFDDRIKVGSLIKDKTNILILENLLKEKEFNNINNIVVSGVELLKLFHFSKTITKNEKISFIYNTIYDSKESYEEKYIKILEKKYENKEKELNVNGVTI